MNKYALAISGMLLLPAAVWSDQSFYCPQNSGYINVGMTQDQVIGACGQPLSKKTTDEPVMQQVPVLQLFFNNVGSNHAFYGVWAMPGSYGNMGTVQPFNGGTSSQGQLLQVNIINNKIDSISLNSSETNAASICGGSSIKVGDPVGSVYSACGSPTSMNKTYINAPIPSKTKPEIWVYQVDQYQSPISLTFIDGKLQSIN